ncbi:hypothetical protein TUZN_0377 [Thermoproteus uzoniensis 768-20]|uniref:Uncharacterized protein n=1 Tax=Thermoproteus uzoniensis (strain 768-20) TaxID=999630 RepID=F2L2T5_THEU7|nr:hypothetical protein [Thermoproteus uzoniensis]AEA11873.1 hypothetical protein TUZN_0377 [Thermoproteus uzoniensis 768-20]
MNRVIPAVIAVAVIIIVVVILLLKPFSPQYPKILNVSAISYPNGVYLYDVYVGSNKVPLVYVQYNQSVLLVSAHNGSEAYLLLSPQRLSELYRTANTTFLLVNYPELLGYTCSNFTITQTITGIPARVSNRVCSPQQFSTSTNFVQVVSALSQVPPPSMLAFSGVAATPFGDAAIYKNSTFTTYLFYTINITYYLYKLNNNVIYKYSIILSMGPSTFNVTYLLRSMSDVNSTYTAIISNLSGEMPIRDMGGLTLVAVAKKVGMVAATGNTTVLAFIGLNDTSSAQLFVDNYTLFRGVGLIILDAPNQPLSYAERLRCLYSSLENKSAVVDLLREIYRGLLNNSTNPYRVLPNSTCPVDISSESALLSLALEGANMPPQTVAPPVFVVVYPNSSYVVVTGYNPSALAAALGR